jgi:hypothetical protein
MPGNIPPPDIGFVRPAEMLIDKPHVPDNQRLIIPPAMYAPSQEQLARPSQFVTFMNTDPVQTHFVINRFNQGVELRPGEKKQIEMTVDGCDTFRHLARTDRGFYPDGPKKGQPFPAHPVKILDAGPIRNDEMVLAPSEPSSPRSKRNHRAPPDAGRGAPASTRRSMGRAVRGDDFTSSWSGWTSSSAACGRIGW